MSNKQHPFNIYQATLFAYQLPFKRAIQFKQYTLSYREGLILRLTDNVGTNHYSEISPLPGFSHETLAEVKQEMSALLSNSLSHFLMHKSRFASIQCSLDSLFFEHTKQHAVLDQAPLLQGDKKQIIKQYQALNRPNCIKLKVARGTVDNDISTFQELCQLNTNLKIRCDANQAWSEQQLALFFSSINVQQLDYIEEPTNKHNINVQLAERYQAAIALDETLQQPDFNYQHHHAIKAFIIKPMIIGNRQKIEHLLSIASQQRMAVCFSSSFESIVGLQILQNMANHYRTKIPNISISLGIDTLKYFNSGLLTDLDNMDQDCQKLEVLWSSK